MPSLSDTKISLKERKKKKGQKMLKQLGGAGSGGENLPLIKKNKKMGWWEVGSGCG